MNRDCIDMKPCMKKRYFSKHFSFALAVVLFSSCSLFFDPCLAQKAGESNAVSLEGLSELKSKVFVDQSADLTLADHVMSTSKGSPNSAFILGYSDTLEGTDKVMSTFIIKFNTLTLELVWKKVLGDIGVPRDLCVAHDEVTQKTRAYIVSTGKIEETRQTIGVVSKLEGLNSPVSPKKSAETVYIARSETSHTLLSSCAIREFEDTSSSEIPNKSTYLYLTGFTRGALFKEESEELSGKKELVALYIDAADDSLKNGVQIAGKDEVDVQGVSVDVSPNIEKEGLVIAAKHGDSSTDSTSTMAMFKLSLDSLSQLVEPSIMNSFTHITPQGIAASPVFSTTTNSSATFMVGDATIAADKRNDVVCNFFNSYGDTVEKPVSLYLDGAKQQKLMDWGTAVKGGADGNAYIAGYSERSQTGPFSMQIAYRVPILLIVDPTGKILLRNEMTSTGDVSQRVMDMEIIEGADDSRVILFIGETTDPAAPMSSPRVFMSGVKIPNGLIESFGFGNIVLPKGIDETKAPIYVEDKKTALPIWLLPLVGALGGVVVLAGLAGTFVLRKRGHGPDTNTGVEEGMEPAAYAELQ